MISVGVVTDGTDVRWRLGRAGHSLGDAFPVLGEKGAGLLPAEVIIVLPQGQIEKS